MNSVKFEHIKGEEDIKEVIKEIFGVELNISGGWGYNSKNAVIVQKLNIPKEQFIHIFATIRATIEMNLNSKDGHRYSGINATQQDSKIIIKDNKTYEKVNFKITAMDTNIYNEFIKEYKDGYGQNSFDLFNHFKRRKENTLIRNVDYWFYGLEAY